MFLNIILSIHNPIKTAFIYFFAKKRHSNKNINLNIIRYSLLVILIFNTQIAYNYFLKVESFISHTEIRAKKLHIKFISFFFYF